MNFLKDIESRISDLLGASPEGNPAPFSLKRLARQASREMERETFVIDGVDTAPALYTVLISTADEATVRQLYRQLAKSLTNHVSAEAKRKGYTFVGEPLARFMADPSLRAGHFAVFAENVDSVTLENLRAEEEAYLSGARQKAPKARRRSQKPTPRSAAPDARAKAPKAAAPVEHSAAPVAAPAPQVAEPVAVPAPQVAAPVVASAPQVPAPAAATPHVVPVAAPQQQAAHLADAVEDAPVVIQAPEPVEAPRPEVATAPKVEAATKIPVTTTEDGKMQIPGLKPLPAPAAPLPGPMSPVLPVDDSVAGLEVVPLDFLDVQHEHMGTLPKVEEEPAPQPMRHAAPIPAPETAPVTRQELPVMCVLLDHQAGRSYRVTTPEAIIGRERMEGNVVLRDPNVSRRHARLTFDGSAWHIADLGSTNGTLVNDVDVAEATLHDGDIITLGLMNLEFREN